MSNPTTPFSWQMPTATDLVTDLPADFEVFGQAVATSMGDLLGGTTGQVLSKTSATDMDFTWVAQDDSNAIQNAIVTAKGDLIGASASATPLVIAVGADGTTLVADSAEATGLKWATVASSSGPTFKATRSGGNQSFSTSTTTKIQYNTEIWDSDSCYDPTTNYRFTPNKAGYYEVTVSALIVQGSASDVYIYIRKNGADNSLFLAGISSASSSAQVNAIVDFNGSSDYIEGFIYAEGSSPSVTGTGSYTYFNSIFIRSL